MPQLEKKLLKLQGAYVQLCLRLVQGFSKGPSVKFLEQKFVCFKYLSNELMNFNESWTDDLSANYEHFKRNPESKARLSSLQARFYVFSSGIFRLFFKINSFLKYLSNASTDFNEIWTAYSYGKYASFKRKLESKALPSPIPAQILV